MLPALVGRPEVAFVGDRVLLGRCAGDSKVGRLSRTRITLSGLGWLYQ